MYQLGHGGYYNNKIYGKYSCRFKGREAVLAVMNNVQQCNVQQRNVQQCSFSKREKLLYERFPFRSGDWWCGGSSIYGRFLRLLFSTIFNTEMLWEYTRFCVLLCTCVEYLWFKNKLLLTTVVNRKLLKCFLKIILLGAFSNWNVGICTNFFVLLCNCVEDL